MSKKTPLNSINLKIKPSKAAAVQEQFGGMGGIPPFFFSPSSTGELDGAFFKVLDEFSDDIENTLKDVHNSLDNWNDMRQGNYPDLFYNHLKLMKNDKIVKNSFMDLSWFFSIFRDFRIFDSNTADHRAPGMGDDQAETDELKTTGIFNPHKLHVDKRLINIFKKHQFGPGSKLNEIGMSDYALYGKPSAQVTKENNSVFNRLRRLYLELKREKYIVVSDDNFKKIAKRVAANNKLEYQRFCYLLLEPFIYNPKLADQLTEGDPDEQPDVMNEAFKKYKNKKLKNDAFLKAAVKLMASSFLNSKGEMKLEDINPRQAVASAGSPGFGVTLAVGIGGFTAVQKSLEAAAKKMSGRAFAGPIVGALIVMALFDGEVDYQLLKIQVNKIKGALQKTLKKHEKEENWSDDELAGVLYDIIDELQRTVLSKFRNFLGSSAFRSLGDKDGDKSSSVNSAYRAFAAEYQKIANIATGVRNLGFGRGQAINKRKAEHMLSEAESLEEYILESYKPGNMARALWRIAEKTIGSIRDEARADLREAEGLKTYCRKDLEMLVLSEIRAGGSTIAVNEVKFKKIEMNKLTWKKCKDEDIKTLAKAWTECLGVGKAMVRFPFRRESRKLAAEIRSLSIEKDTMNVKLADPEIAYYRLYKESSIPRKKLGEGLVPKDNPKCKEAYLNTLYTSDIRTGFYNRFLFGLEKENIGSYEVTIAPNYTGQKHSTTKNVSVPFAYYHEQESQNHKDLLKAGDIKGILSNKAVMAQTAMKELLVATKAVVGAAPQGGADGKFVEVFKDCLLILEPLFDKIQDLAARDVAINGELSSIKINVQDLTENKWIPGTEAYMAKSNPERAKGYKAKMIKVEKYHRLAKQKIEVLMHLQMLSSILDNSSIPYVYHNFNGGALKTIADKWRKEEQEKKAKEKQQASAVPAIPAAAKKPADVQVPPRKPAPQSVPTAVKKTGAQPSREYQRKQSSLLKSLNIKPADLVKRLQDAGYFGNDKKSPIKEEAKQEAFVYTSEFKEAIIKLQKYFGMPDCADNGKPCADGLYGPNTHRRWETVGFVGPQASTETKAAGEKKNPGKSDKDAIKPAAQDITSQTDKDGNLWGKTNYIVSKPQDPFKAKKISDAAEKFQKADDSRSARLRMGEAAQEANEPGYPTESRYRVLDDWAVWAIRHGIFYYWPEPIEDPLNPNEVKGDYKKIIVDNWVIKGVISKGMHIQMFRNKSERDEMGGLDKRVNDQIDKFEKESENTNNNEKTQGKSDPKADQKKKKELKKPESAPAGNPWPKKHRVKKDDKSAQFNMDDLLKQAIAEVKRGRNNNE